MAREDLHFRLRIPEDLKNKVEEAASLNRRSMTAEIVDRLEKSFLNQGSADVVQLSPIYLNEKDAAKYVGLDVGTFFEGVVRGVFPKPRVILSQKIWDVNELDEYIKGFDQSILEDYD